MKFCLLPCVLLVLAPLLEADSVAAQLARRAEEARSSGQIVRAYMLFAEAASREPDNRHYTSNRDGLAPAAKLLAKMDVQNANVTEEINQVKEEESHRSSAEPPVEMAHEATWEKEINLQPLPRLQPVEKTASFDLRGDERTLFRAVTSAYGLRVTFDTALDAHSNLHFEISKVDFHTAMEALTAATGTFTFAVSPKQIFVARNTENKRNQFEPQALLTFQLPNALEQKDLVEAANAVRTVLKIRSIGWDSVNRTVMVRDRVTRAKITYGLLEALLLPKAQVSLEVQIISVDTQKMYHYGVALPTSFQLGLFGHTTGGFRNVLPDLGSALKFVTFGGGASLLGVALADSSVFATYTNVYSHSLYDATVNVSEGQTANFHVGDQYPIAQSLYTGFAQNTPSIYNPVPQINLVDLGIVLKMSPKVGGANNIALDIEAEYKALGSQTFNTVPSILERQFKGSVSLREGEWAVIGGLDSDSESVTRNGLAGLSQIPGVNQVLSENSRDKQTSRTLIVIKPTLKSLPLSATVSPQFLIGPERGQSVLF